MASQEKTEQATPRRRQDARERGQVAKSTDINAVLVFLAVLLLARVLMLRQYDSMASVFRYHWGRMGDLEISTDTMSGIARTILLEMGDFLWPIMVVAFTAAVLSNIMQVGFLLTGKAIRFDGSRINPVNGFKRLVSLRSAVELTKSIVKIILVSYAAYSTLWGRRELLFVLPEQTVQGIMLIVGEVAFQIAVRAALMLLILALADYGFQRWQYEKDLRMTRQEVRDEYKRQEGDPLLRQRIRQRQREMAQRRMMDEVPEADVVITNPTHLAIALRYDPDQMTAPRVVAKGERLMAERIRRAAAEHDVPIVENRDLARALFKSVPLGAEIPFDLYHAVSQVLAYVYRITGKIPAYATAA